MFTVRALATAGLFDPLGDFYSFSEEVKPVDDATWRVGFGRSRCGIFTNRKGETYETCKSVSGETDAWITVALRGGRWNVVALDGNFDADTISGLKAFSLPDTQEVPHWEFSTARAGDKGTVVRGAGLWVGPIPYEGPGSRCRTRAYNDAGSLIYEGHPEYIAAPDEDWERAGGIHGSEF